MQMFPNGLQNLLFNNNFQSAHLLHLEKMLEIVMLWIILHTCKIVIFTRAIFTFSQRLSQCSASHHITPLPMDKVFDVFLTTICQQFPPKMHIS